MNAPRRAPSSCPATAMPAPGRLIGQGTRALVARRQGEVVVEQFLLEHRNRRPRIAALMTEVGVGLGRRLVRIAVFGLLLPQEAGVRDGRAFRRRMENNSVTPRDPCDFRLTLGANHHSRSVCWHRRATQGSSLRYC